MSPPVVAVVAIDGAAGAGKSTLARALAGALGLAYLNTGLMYRALTLSALESGVDPSDGPGLARLLSSLRFRLDRSADPPSLEIDGSTPGPELESQEVEAVVSEVAGHLEVRGPMSTMQRRLAGGGGVVEGRDIGSVVFPDADLKIFLTASRGERASRRTEERPEGARVAQALHRRDARDARTNPPVPAEDAVVIDTTDLGPEETFHAALELCRDAGLVHS